MEDSFRVNQGARRGSPQGVQDARQELLPGPRHFFKCQIAFCRLYAVPNAPPTGLNRDKSAYSGIKSNLLISQSSRREPQPKVSLLVGNDPLRPVRTAPNHSKNRVNSLKFGYARIISLVGKNIIQFRLWVRRGHISTPLLVGLARCACPVAERSVRRRDQAPQNALRIPSVPPSLRQAGKSQRDFRYQNQEQWQDVPVRRGHSESSLTARSEASSLFPSSKPGMGNARRGFGKA